MDARVKELEDQEKHKPARKSCALLTVHVLPIVRINVYGYKLGQEKGMRWNLDEIETTRCLVQRQTIQLAKANDYPTPNDGNNNNNVVNESEEEQVESDLGGYSSSSGSDEPAMTIDQLYAMAVELVRGIHHYKRHLRTVRARRQQVEIRRREERHQAENRRQEERRQAEIRRENQRQWHRQQQLLQLQMRQQQQRQNEGTCIPSGVLMADSGINCTICFSDCRIGELVYPKERQGSSVQIKVHA